MNDQALMCVRNTGTNKQKEFQPLPQLDLFAVEVDGCSMNVLHHQIRLAALGMPGVDQVNDRGMLERCEHLPFGQEPIAPNGALLFGAQNFDRYLEPDLAIGAFGQPDGSHAALADLRDEGVWADGLSGESRLDGKRNPRLLKEIFLRQ